MESTGTMQGCHRKQRYLAVHSGNDVENKWLTLLPRITEGNQATSQGMDILAYELVPQHWQKCNQETLPRSAQRPWGRTSVTNLLCPLRSVVSTSYGVPCFAAFRVRA